MVAPGASNWNEIFPDVAAALAERATLHREGKAARVLGALSDGLARRRRDALRSDVVSRALRGRGGVGERAPSTARASRAIFRVAFFGVGRSRVRGRRRALGGRSRSVCAPRRHDTDRRALLGRSVRRRRGGAHGRRRICARFASTPKRVETRSLRRAAAAARECGVRDVPRGAPLRRARAQVSDRAGSARDVRRRARACRRSGPDRAMRDLFWSSIGCGSCATRTKISRRSTSGPGATRAATGILASNLERYHLAAQRAIALRRRDLPGDATTATFAAGDAARSRRRASSDAACFVLARLCWSSRYSCTAPAAGAAGGAVRWRVAMALAAGVPPGRLGDDRHERRGRSSRRSTSRSSSARCSGA